MRIFVFVFNAINLVSIFSLGMDHYFLSGGGGVTFFIKKIVRKL